MSNTIASTPGGLKLIISARLSSINPADLSPGSSRFVFFLPPSQLFNGRREDKHKVGWLLVCLQEKH